MKLNDSPKLIELGFQHKLKWNNEPEPDKYILPGWEPEPKLEFPENCQVGYAKAGSQQFFIRNELDLERFVTKSVPAFCDPKPKKVFKSINYNQ